MGHRGRWENKKELKWQELDKKFLSFFFSLSSHVSIAWLHRPRGAQSIIAVLSRLDFSLSFLLITKHSTRLHKSTDSQVTNVERGSFTWNGCHALGQILSTLNQLLLPLWHRWPNATLGIKHTASDPSFFTARRHVRVLINFGGYFSILPRWLQKWKRKKEHDRD